jgi:phosphoribosylglycinamide formyltransferase-1
MERLALFISGGGTTALTIIKACQPGGELEDFVEPVLVVASNPNAKGINRIIDSGLVPEKDVVVRIPRAYGDGFGGELISLCRARDVTLFGQYGWLALTPENFLRAYPRGINQHPAPLSPGNLDFGGKKMHGLACHAAVLLFRRWTDRDFWTRAVAHRVTANYDEGAVIKMQDVPILKGDTPQALAERVLPVEYQVQIAALRDFAMATVQESNVAPLVLPHEKVLWSMACEAAKTLYSS